MHALNNKQLIFVVLMILSILISSCSQNKTTIKPSAKPSLSASKTPAPTPTPTPTPTITITPTPEEALGDKIPIIGKSVLTSEQLCKYAQKLNRNFNPEIANAYLSISALYNLRGDIAFCQSVHETGSFTSSQSKFNNFAGIGGSKPLHYASINDGVRGHIQLLFIYATKDPLPTNEPNLGSKSYMKSTNRGRSPLWIDLAGFWAMPGYDTTKYKSLADAKAALNSYGHTILNTYAKASKM